MVLFGISMLLSFLALFCSWRAAGGRMRSSRRLRRRPAAQVRVLDVVQAEAMA